MITEEQRADLSRSFKVDTAAGVSAKAVARMDAISETALQFAKCVMENCDPDHAGTTSALEKIKAAHWLAVCTARK